MIAVPEGSSILVITQSDHAHLSGELLSLWRADGLPAHPRRDDLLFAAREHDNGWREADAAPRWDPARGLPHDFMTLPARARIELWERGVCRFAAERFQGRRGEERWTAFLDFAADFERSLLEETGVARADLEKDYEWIDLADLISLTACTRRSGAAERYGVRIEPGAGEIRLDPCPLAGATTFRVPCRRIPRRDYRSDAELGGEIATARWEEMAVRIS
jgi:hypothetical protein